MPLRVHPSEDGKVLISRATISCEFPARVVLVAAMNPCPCGYLTHPGKPCSCHPGAVQRYLMKISGPLMDRIDLHVEVPAVRLEELRARRAPEGSTEVRERVLAARQRQRERFRDSKGVYCNAHMSARDLNEICHLTPTAQRVLEVAMNSLNLSARAYDRLRRVARTIADMDGAAEIEPSHVSEAVQYRTLDRGNWMGTGN